MGVGDEVMMLIRLICRGWRFTVVMSNRVQRGIMWVLLIGVVLGLGFGMGVFLPARALFLSRTFFKLK